MTTPIKRMDIKEFREKGFLQEINRLFLHPLGLALEVDIHDDGTESLGGIWDYRSDPEGMLFAQEMINEKKIRYVEELRAFKLKTRITYAKEHNFIMDKDGIQQIC